MICSISPVPIKKNGILRITQRTSPYFSFFPALTAGTTLLAQNHLSYDPDILSSPHTFMHWFEALM